MKTMTAILLALAVALGGCTFAVPFDATPLVDSKKKIDLDVGLFMDESQMTQVYSRSGFCLIGMAHTWDIQTGAASASAAQKTFSQMFRSVEMLRTTGGLENRPLTMVITPTIGNFAVSQGLTAELLLNCTIVDRAGQTVYQNTINASGGSQMMTGCCLGALGGQSALGKTSSEAFSRAYTLLAADIMSTVDFSPYL